MTADKESSLGRGIALIAGSAVVWSFGGTIARYIHIADPWTIVFWRALFAALFLLAFMLVRDGMRGTVDLARGIGLGGLAVALSFTISSATFIVALQHTTVANILLMQAGAPLIAALLAWGLYGERVSRATWAAIACVILGVGVMVSDTLSGNASALGNILALVISVTTAIATVLTRRFAHVRMTPAVFLSALMQAALAAVLSTPKLVTANEFGLLFLFGAVNLGVGLALFVTGVRLVPAALAALVGVLEPVLGPIWVWLVHGEVPSLRTLIGGSLVFLALFVHLLLEWRRNTRARPPVIPI